MRPRRAGHRAATPLFSCVAVKRVTLFLARNPLRTSKRPKGPYRKVRREAHYSPQTRIAVGMPTCHYLSLVQPFLQQSYSLETIK
jgi:hypothetical protein